MDAKAIFHMGKSTASLGLIVSEGARELEQEILRLREENEQLALTVDTMRQQLARPAAAEKSLKREVMTMVALHFSSLFDVGVELKDSNFNEMLQVVWNRTTEFVERESRPRQIMALGPNQLKQKSRA